MQLRARVMQPRQSICYVSQITNMRVLGTINELRLRDRVRKRCKIHVDDNTKLEKFVANWMVDIIETK